MVSPSQATPIGGALAGRGFVNRGSESNGALPLDTSDRNSRVKRLQMEGGPPREKTICIVLQGPVQMRLRARIVSTSRRPSAPVLICHLADRSISNDINRVELSLFHLPVSLVVGAENELYKYLDWSLPTLFARQSSPVQPVQQSRRKTNEPCIQLHLSRFHHPVSTYMRTSYRLVRVPAVESTLSTQQFSR